MGCQTSKLPEPAEECKDSRRSRGKFWKWVSKRKRGFAKLGKTSDAARHQGPRKGQEEGEAPISSTDRKLATAVHVRKTSSVDGAQRRGANSSDDGTSLTSSTLSESTALRAEESRDSRATRPESTDAGRIDDLVARTPPVTKTVRFHPFTEVIELTEEESEVSGRISTDVTGEEVARPSANLPRHLDQNPEDRTGEWVSGVAAFQDVAAEPIVGDHVSAESAASRRAGRDLQRKPVEERKGRRRREFKEEWVAREKWNGGSTKMDGRKGVQLDMVLEELSEMQEEGAARDWRMHKRAEEARLEDLRAEEARKEAQRQEEKRKVERIAKNLREIQEKAERQRQEKEQEERFERYARALMVRRMEEMVAADQRQERERASGSGLATPKATATPRKTFGRVDDVREKHVGANSAAPGPKCGDDLDSFYDKAMEGLRASKEDDFETRLAALERKRGGESGPSTPKGKVPMKHEGQRLDAGKKETGEDEPEYYFTDSLDKFLRQKAKKPKQTTPTKTEEKKKAEEKKKKKKAGPSKSEEELDAAIQEILGIDDFDLDPLSAKKKISQRSTPPARQAVPSHVTKPTTTPAPAPSQTFKALQSPRNSYYPEARRAEPTSHRSSSATVNARMADPRPTQTTRRQPTSTTTVTGRVPSYDQRLYNKTFDVVRRTHETSPGTYQQPRGSRTQGATPPRRRPVRPKAAIGGRQPAPLVGRIPENALAFFQQQRR